MLEATARWLGSTHRVAALAGDLATDRDARRTRAAGIPSVAIATGTACHLDAELVHEAAHQLVLDGLRFAFIENVGNLVCPAVYDLGQERSVVALAITEGEDKPFEYPVMFRKADLVRLAKADLLPYLPEVRIAAFREALAHVMPDPAAIVLSARTGQGVQEWVKWLHGRRMAAHLPLAPRARGQFDSTDVRGPAGGPPGDRRIQVAEGFRDRAGRNVHAPTDRIHRPEPSA